MNTIARKIGITLLTAATAIAPLAATSAQAGDWRWSNPPYGSEEYSANHFGGHRDYRKFRHERRVHRRHDNTDAIVLGIIGLSVGAIIAGALAEGNAAPAPVYRQPTVGGGAYQPWTKSWMRYCSKKYRSFNASTGTYRGYDGQDHFCVAR